MELRSFPSSWNEQKIPVRRPNSILKGISQKKIWWSDRKKTDVWRCCNGGMVLVEDGRGKVRLDSMKQVCGVSTGVPTDLSQVESTRSPVQMQSGESTRPLPLHNFNIHVSVSGRSVFFCVFWRPTGFAPLLCVAQGRRRLVKLGRARRLIKPH